MVMLMYFVSLESVVLVLVFDRGMRSGTVPHILAVGMGAACEIAQREMEVVWTLLFTLVL